MNNDFFSIDWDNLLNMDTFIGGSKNTFALSILDAFVNDRDNARALYNPLLLRADTSGGKTHILEGIAKKLHLSNPKMKIALGSALLLQNLFSENQKAIYAKRKQELYSADALLIDDIHLLAHFSDIQQELVNVFDQLHKQKKIIVCTLSTRISSVQDIPLNMPLISRLSAGVVLTIASPDLDVRMRFISQKFIEYKIQCSKNVQLLLARRCLDLRQLSGVINKVIAFYSMTNTVPDEEEIESLLENAGAVQDISPERIISITASQLGLTAKDLRGKARKSEVVLARQISMYICRKLTGLSYPRIALALGGKDHTTVIYACNKIEELKTTDRSLNAVINQIIMNCTRG